MPDLCLTSLTMIADPEGCLSIECRCRSVGGGESRKGFCDVSRSLAEPWRAKKFGAAQGVGRSPPEPHESDLCGAKIG